MTANRNSSRNRRKSNAAVAPAPVVAKTVDDAQLVSHARWQEEYGYVFHDLRKLGIVAASLFAIIIILGFFL
jgi:hypothetical protein